MTDSKLTPLISYNDANGNPVFRIERDGTIFAKGVHLHDGTVFYTADAVSPTPALVDGGLF